MACFQQSSVRCDYDRARGYVDRNTELDCALAFVIERIAEQVTNVGVKMGSRVELANSLTNRHGTGSGISYEFYQK